MLNNCAIWSGKFSDKCNIDDTYIVNNNDYDYFKILVEILEILQVSITFMVVSAYYWYA